MGRLMSTPDPNHFVEIRQAGLDEFMRPVFTLAMVCDGDRTVVWDGHSHAEAIEAARFWAEDGVEVVDLVVPETLQ